jgi:hypothetical protein
VAVLHEHLQPGVLPVVGLVGGLAAMVAGIVVATREVPEDDLALIAGTDEPYPVDDPDESEDDIHEEARA